MNEEILKANSSTQLAQQIQYTQKRFIAFLDIMGFKDRVARREHEEILSELEEFQSKISQYVSYQEKSEIQIALFSDSILIYSKDDSEDSLKSISQITKHVMMYAIQQQIPIPLKGAIAAGMMTCNQTKQLYFGQALIDAYLLQESTKYYGIIAHHTAEKYIKDYKNDSFRDINAPLKSGIISHYELNWYDVELQNIENQKTLNECFAQLRLTVSDEPRKYIDNTMKVIKENKNA